MADDKMLLGQMLLDAGEINQVQLSEALKVQEANGGRLGVVLVELGYLSSGLLANYLAKQTAATISKFKSE